MSCLRSPLSYSHVSKRNIPLTHINMTPTFLASCVHINKHWHLYYVGILYLETASKYTSNALKSDGNRQCGIYFHCSRTVPRYYKYASMSDSHVSTRCQRLIGGFHVLLEESLVIQSCLPCIVSSNGEPMPYSYKTRIICLK
jgi:hypothetical protein